MNTYQAGIDVGSTTVKLVVLDENGQMIFELLIFELCFRHMNHVELALADFLK